MTSQCICSTSLFPRGTTCNRDPYSSIQIFIRDPGANTAALMRQPGSVMSCPSEPHNNDRNCLMGSLLGTACPLIYYDFPNRYAVRCRLRTRVRCRGQFNVWSRLTYPSVAHCTALGAIRATNEISSLWQSPSHWGTYNTWCEVPHLRPVVAIVFARLFSFNCSLVLALYFILLFES